jgi:hypothetical protein
MRQKSPAFEQSGQPLAGSKRVASCLLLLALAWFGIDPLGAHAMVDQRNLQYIR